MKIKLFAMFGLVATAIGAVAAISDSVIPYPDGYREWTHVKSMVIEHGHPLYGSFGGIHHLYANEKALQGYRGGRFPDGSVIVFDLLEASTSDAAITEGKRKVLGVMHKDAARFATTGGWGFEAFSGDSKNERVVREQAQTACFGCHAAQKSKDYVFSGYRP